MNDAEALEQCRRRESGGLQVLFERYHEKVFRLAFGLLGGREEAEDAVQDIFIKVFHKADRFDGRAGFSTWLYRLATNHCLDVLRRRKFRVFWSELQWKREPDRRAETSGDPFLQKTLQNALQSLPPLFRACLLLHEVEERPYEEIAAILEVPVGTVKSTLYRAKKKMREALTRAESMGERP